jgi:hypothetical protein
MPRTTAYGCWRNKRTSTRSDPPAMETTLWPMLTEWASVLGSASAGLDPSTESVERVAVER